MKKIFPLVLSFLLLCSCSAPQISVSPKTEFTYDSVITIGDFSYHALVKYSNGVVYITPKTTHAAGMTISCDGKNIRFMQKSYSNSIPIEKVSNRNPAKLLYDILSSIDKENVLYKDTMYLYQGKINSGSYCLSQNQNGDYISLEIKDISFSMEFNNK